MGYNLYMHYFKNRADLFIQKPDKNVQEILDNLERIYKDKISQKNEVWSTIYKYKLYNVKSLSVVSPLLKPMKP